LDPLTFFPHPFHFVLVGGKGGKGFGNNHSCEARKERTTFTLSEL
jgi:hypothetical protein